jgi:hypothetical protein
VLGASASRSHVHASDGGECWRDPKCTLALPRHAQKPETIKSIDADKLANARRLGETVKQRAASTTTGEFAGVADADDLAQAWDCDDVEDIDGVFDDADAAFQSPVGHARKPSCTTCFNATCICSRVFGSGPGYGVQERENPPCGACEYSPCACELLELQAASKRAAVPQLFYIG